MLATDGLFCCIKHFVGGQLYIMRGKSAILGFNYVSFFKVIHVFVTLHGTEN